jgi:hypothetical protein
MELDDNYTNNNTNNNNYTDTPYKNIMEKIDYIMSKNFVFQTDIDGNNYYLIITNSYEKDTPYKEVIIDNKKHKLLGHICSNRFSPQKFIKPELIRGDILKKEFKKFKKNTKNNKDIEESKNKGKKVYPRFSHHLHLTNNINNDSYYLSGLTINQANDFSRKHYDIYFHTRNSFLESNDYYRKKIDTGNNNSYYVPIIEQDKMFLCAKQTEYNKKYFEIFIEPINKKIYKKNSFSSLVRLYVIGNVKDIKNNIIIENVKFYIARLSITENNKRNKNRYPIKYPIVLLPFDYTGGIYKNGIDYSYCKIINFQISTNKINPI